MTERQIVGDLSRPAAAWASKAAARSSAQLTTGARPVAPVAPTAAARRSVRSPLPSFKSPAPASWVPGRSAAKPSPQPQPATIAAIQPRRSERTLRSLQGLSKSLMAALLAFLASAIAVVAIAALVFPRPLGVAGAESGSGAAPAEAGDQPSAGLSDSPVSVTDVQFASDGAPVSPAALGSLRIPVIKLETDVYSGVHDSIVELGPGLWPGTPLPGTAGNAVLAGHRTSHTHPFRDLDKLTAGDLIQVTQGSGPTTDFQVVSVVTVRESEYVEYVLAEPASADAVSITLFACAPKGSRTHRIVVRATAPPAVPEGAAEGGDA